MPDPNPDPEPLSQREDDEGTEDEDEDEEDYETEFEDEELDYDDDEEEQEDEDYDESEFEDEEIDYGDDEEEQEDEDYDETEDGELDQQNVQQPLVPQVSGSHNTVALESSSSPPIVASGEEATNEQPSSSIPVESSEWNRSEIDGLFCPICMEAWTNEGDHHICCLPCGHIYGMSCIKKWLELRKNSAKCPQCNQRCTLKGVRKLYASQLVTVDEGLHKLIKAHGMRWTINGKESDLPLMRPTTSTQPPPQSSMDQIINQLSNLGASLSQMLDKMRLEQHQTLERMDKIVEEMDKMKLGQGRILERMDRMEQQQASYRGMIHDLSRYVYGIYQNRGWNYPLAYDFPPPGFYPPPPPPDIPYPYPPQPPPPPSDA